MRRLGVAYLVHRLDNPVDAGVTADSLVLRVDKDDLEVLIGGVLVDPVGVEDTKIATAAANTFFGRRLERALILKLVHSLVRWFA